MAAKPGRTEKTAALKGIITDLHGGLSVEEAKERFESEIGDISSTEIAELEQGLIDGGVQPEEIKQFCDVHALLFRVGAGEGHSRRDLALSPHRPVPSRERTRSRNDWAPSVRPRATKPCRRPTTSRPD